MHAPSSRVAVSTLLFILGAGPGCRGCHNADESGDDSSSHSDDTTIDDSVPPVDADDDGYSIDVDCDDNNSAVHPEAEELCNAMDDDCDSMTDEGIPSALFLADDGVQTSLIEGETNTISAPGLITICGLFNGRLKIQNSVTIQADSAIENSFDNTADYAVISGFGIEGSVVVVEYSEEGTKGNLQIKGVSVTNGTLGSCTLADSTSKVGGGGICCDVGEPADREPPLLSLSGVVISDNSANNGGGLFLDGCDSTVVDSVIIHNSAANDGGGVATYGGELVFSSTSIQNNESMGTGGGLRIYSGSSVEFLYGDISNNSAATGGAVSMAASAYLHCSLAKIIQNRTLAYSDGGGGGAVWFSAYGPGVFSEGCDWGSDSENNYVGESINDFDSTELHGMENQYDFGNETNFTCTYDTCPVP